jgi:hypothetical protein
MLAVSREEGAAKKRDLDSAGRWTQSAGGIAAVEQGILDAACKKRPHKKDGSFKESKENVDL